MKEKKVALGLVPYHSTPRLHHEVTSATSTSSSPISSPGAVAPSSRGMVADSAPKV